MIQVDSRLAPARSLPRHEKSAVYCTGSRKELQFHGIGQQKPFEL